MDILNRGEWVVSFNGLCKINVTMEGVSLGSDLVWRRGSSAASFSSSIIIPPMRRESLLSAGQAIEFSRPWRQYQYIKPVSALPPINFDGPRWLKYANGVVWSSGSLNEIGRKCERAVSGSAWDEPENGPILYPGKARGLLNKRRRPADFPPSCYVR